MALYEFDENNIYKAFAIDNNGYHKDLEDISNGSSNANKPIVYADTLRTVGAGHDNIPVIIIDPEVNFQEIFSGANSFLQYKYEDEENYTDIDTNNVDGSVLTTDSHSWAFLLKNVPTNGKVNVRMGNDNTVKEYIVDINAQESQI